jgi:hypothetical protein
MDFSDASGALQRYKASLTSGRSAYDQALASQLGALEQPVDRRGALLRMAQGFLSPTKTGAFAENAGMAIGNYTDANDKLREQEMDRAMKLAQIQAARAKLQMEGAGQDFDLFSKGQSMMQSQRREGLLDILHGGAGPDLSGVAADASAGAGFDMPSLPGLDASGFAPGFNNAPVDAPVRRVTPQRHMPDEAAGEQRQMEDMMRLRALEEEAAGADLPPAPNRVGVQPGPGAAMQVGDAPMAYASGPAQEPSLLSPEMAITPEQMQRFQRPQPQPAAPQQAAPQQQQSQLGGADAVFAAAEQQRARLQQIGQQNPGIRSLPEYRDEIKRVEDILLKGDTSLIREYRAFQEQDPNWQDRAPTLLDYELLRKRAGATSVTVGGQESAFNSKAGTFVAEQASGAYEDAARQQERLRQYQQIVGLLNDPNVFTGSGGQTIANLKQFGKTFLGMEGIEGVGNVEAAERIRAALFAGFRSEMLTGATSNADREFVMRIPPNISDSSEGLQLILKMQEQAAEVAEKRAAIFDDLVQKSPGGSLNLKDFGEYRRRLAEISAFSPEDMRAVVDVARKNAQQAGPLAGLPLDQVPSDILQDALNGLLTRDELETFLASQGSSR